MAVNSGEAFGGILVGRGWSITCAGCDEEIPPEYDVCPRCGCRVGRTS